MYDIFCLFTDRFHKLLISMTYWINSDTRSKVYKIIGKDTYHFTGIIDIFVEIADTLGLNFEEENDILLGDEI